MKGSTVNALEFDLPLVCNNRVMKISRPHLIFWKVIVASNVQKRPEGGGNRFREIS